MFKRIGALALGIALLASPALAGNKATYVIDTSHAYVGFEVSHLVVSKTRGQFKEFEGVIHFDEKKPEKSEVEVTIQAASIDTENAKRDDHLRNADFFDVDNHPTLTFKSASIKKKGKDSYSVTGDLTIRGITKSVTFPAKYRGKAESPWGQSLIGFEGELVIDRRDFEVAWTKKNKQGKLVVGNEVEITLDFEAVKK